jgi:hypothetical protein
LVKFEVRKTEVHILNGVCRWLCVKDNDIFRDLLDRIRWRDMIDNALGIVQNDDDIYNLWIMGQIITFHQKCLF